MVVATKDAVVGIRIVSEQTGLSVDTLRWYEREGLVPLVDRSGAGRRQYSVASVGFVRLVQALHRTGMPVAEARQFVRLMDEGAASHRRSMALLEQQATLLEHRQRQLEEDRATLQHKIAHYRQLIDQGLDCNGNLVDEATATQQRQGATR